MQSGMSKHDYFIDGNAHDWYFIILFNGIVWIVKMWWIVVVQAHIAFLCCTDGFIIFLRPCVSGSEYLSWRLLPVACGL